MFEIDKKKFGAFVAELRREKGITQKELAETLYLSDKAISKWETAASIPDTALLIPLAEQLGVTVTELLMCQRMERDSSMDTAQVEDMVKTALAYSEEDTTRVCETRTKWPLIYLCAVITGGIGMLLSYRDQILNEALFTPVLLGVIFGAYFCFFVKTRLPVFYDENRCGFYRDGVFRMNIPGIVFNNSNWPYIVRVGRIWSCLSVALFPVINLGMWHADAAIWQQIGVYVFLLLQLGGLFVPVYVVGKKYE